MSIPNLKPRDWHPTNLLNVNRVPIDKADWALVKDWCHERGMRTGELIGMLLRDWMEREGLRDG